MFHLLDDRLYLLSVGLPDASLFARQVCHENQFQDTARPQNMINYITPQSDGRPMN